METTPVLRKPTDDLFAFAWMPAKGADIPSNKIYESRLRELAERAQPECWSFDASAPFAILGNYLRYTFKQAAFQEGKIEEGLDKTGPGMSNYKP
jgi:hypothetical protein